MLHRVMLKCFIVTGVGLLPNNRRGYAHLLSPYRDSSEVEPLCGPEQVAGRLCVAVVEPMQHAPLTEGPPDALGLPQCQSHAPEGVIGQRGGPGDGYTTQLESPPKRRRTLPARRAQTWVSLFSYKLTAIVDYSRIGSLYETL